MHILPLLALTACSFQARPDRAQPSQNNTAIPQSPPGEAKETTGSEDSAKSGNETNSDRSDESAEPKVALQVLSTKNGAADAALSEFDADDSAPKSVADYLSKTGALSSSGPGSVGSNALDESRVRGSMKMEAATIANADAECAARIKKVIRRKRSQVKLCYEKYLRINPSLKGRVVITFDILETGKTAGIDIKNDTGNKDLARCIKRKSKLWRFGTECATHAAFPFVLAPAN